MKQSPPPNRAEATRYHIFKMKEKQKVGRKGKKKEYGEKKKTCRELIVFTNLIISFDCTNRREISQCPCVYPSACHHSSLNMTKFGTILRLREGEVFNQDPPAYTVEAEDIDMIFGRLL
jgi:hypothetical protein